MNGGVQDSGPTDTTQGSSTNSRQKIRTVGASSFSGTTLGCWMCRMAEEAPLLAPIGGAGRPRRPRGTPLRQLKARVSEEAVQCAHRAAAALGVTTAEYIEALVLHDEPGPDGRPVWWTKPAPRDREELPLTQSA
jgi:hypothetical protein